MRNGFKNTLTHSITRNNRRITVLNTLDKRGNYILHYYTLH